MPPAFFVLAPVMITSTYFAAVWAVDHMDALPGPTKQLADRYARYLSVVKDVRFQQELLLQAALIEVMLIFFLVLLLFVGRGNLFHIVLHMQFLRMRYTLHHPSKQAWAYFGDNLTAVFCHRLSPGFVGTAWHKFKELAHRWGTVYDPAQQQQRQQ